MCGGVFVIDFKPGDIGFHMGSAFTSKAFSWFMDSKFSHAFIVCDVVRTQSMTTVYVLETSDFEVTISTIDKYLESKGAMEVFRIDDFRPLDQMTIKREGFKLLNTIYGYLQIVGFAWKNIGRKLGFKAKNFSRQGVVCCHVVYYAIAKCINCPLPKEDVEQYDTEELYQQILGSKNIKRVYQK